MNKQWFLQRPTVSTERFVRSINLSRCVRLGLTTTLGAALVFGPPRDPQAQQRAKEPVVKVTGIAAGANGVSISADNSLNRAQTWQDREGFHVVLVNGEAGLASGTPRGVKVRHVGGSLELVVPLSAGASVTVQPRGNRLDLVVSGGSVSSGDGAEQSPALENHSSTPARASKERAAESIGRERNASGASKRQEVN
ncbi:MAG: hypothetical protein WCD76_14470, partial [Pyrinomonadaceae bacterium]